VTTFGGSVWHGPSTGDPAAVEDVVGVRHSQTAPASKMEN
jgi:hypothetical protein